MNTDTIHVQFLELGGAAIVAPMILGAPRLAFGLQGQALHGIAGYEQGDHARQYSAHLPRLV